MKQFYKQFILIIRIVSEQHPGKQGLKHTGRPTLKERRRVSEQHPGKQGLKQQMHVGDPGFVGVSEQHPGKQGLKQVERLVRPHVHAVSEQHPGKQGLKLRNPENTRNIAASLRATSRKTRIETAGIDAVTLVAARLVSEQHPGKQGLKFVVLLG